MEESCAKKGSVVKSAHLLFPSGRLIKKFAVVFMDYYIWMVEWRRSIEKGREREENFRIGFHTFH